MLADAAGALLAALIFVAAMLYASVGHAGASGYLAAMALFGVAPAVMKPTALALNILVAVIATLKFYRVGAFSWRIFLPLAAGSIPLAWLGGTLTLPGHVYKPLVGVVLIYAAWASLRRASAPPGGLVGTPSLPVLFLCGAALGFLSGLTGVGGGIFLSPLLLFLRWAEVRTISGIAAAFILVNSIAGLLGVMRVAPALPEALPLWALAAVTGGFIGAELGSRRLGNAGIQRALALVLVIAGAKMILTT
jgi:uncharacterized protein